MMSAQHAKSMIVDDALVITGSLNFTHNSVNYCDEACMATRALGPIKDYAAHYEFLWQSAEPLEVSYIADLMTRTDAQKSAKSAARSSRSSSST